MGELLDTLKKTKQLFIDRDLQIIRSEHNKINNELQQVRQILDNLRGHRIDGVTDDLLETRIDELMDTADRLNTRDQYLFDEYQRLNSLSTSYKAYYQNLLNRNFLTGNQQIFGPPDVSQSLTDFLNYADTVSKEINSLEEKTRLDVPDDIAHIDSQSEITKGIVYTGIMMEKRNYLKK